jgi:hypothetical protein
LAHAISAGLNRTYTAAAGRKFAFTVAAAFLVFSAIARVRGHAVSWLVFATIATVLATAGILLPAKLGPIDRAWMAMAKAIAKVTTPIFMAVLYFVVVTPIAFLRRTLGGNGLVHRSGQLGYWLDRTQSPRGSMERQF